MRWLAAGLCRVESRVLLRRDASETVQAMSFSEHFHLPNLVTSYDRTQVEEFVRSIVPSNTRVEVRSDGAGDFCVLWAMAPNLVEEAAQLLGDSPQTWLNYEWRADMDPPQGTIEDANGRSADGYEMWVEFVDVTDETNEDTGPEYLIRVSSNDGGNREAWPLAFALAGRLAEEFDALDEPPWCPDCG